MDSICCQQYSFLTILEKYYLMKYFVSYTTIDEEITKEVLINISNKIKEIGEVFIDIIDNNSIDKQARVLSELDNSDVLLLIKTKNIYNSNWVKLELQRAESNNIPVKAISINTLNQLVDFKAFLIQNPKSPD